MHLGRGPVEETNPSISSFYSALIACLNDPAFRDGQWQLLDARSAWDGNGSHDAFVTFAWSAPDDRRRIVAVNYADHRSQCYVTLPWGDLGGRTWRVRDRLGEAVYDRDGSDLSGRGLYLDVPAWATHVFDVTPGD
jgi:hypothetical protein